MAEQLTLLMLIAQPLCTSAELNLRDRIWGEVEKNCFNVLPGKGGHRGLMPSTVCSQPRRVWWGVLYRWFKAGGAGMCQGVCAGQAVS